MMRPQHYDVMRFSFFCVLGNLILVLGGLIPGRLVFALGRSWRNGNGFA